MMTKATKALEQKLRGLNYPEIERSLRRTKPQMLIEMLDSKFIKIGDSAAGLLRGGQAYHLLISAIVEGRITTRIGKIRANNTLFRSGRRYPEALNAYLAFLNDRNDEIAYEALLALVFWGDKRVIPSIKQRATSIKSAADEEEFERACGALGRSDPAIFNPHFTDYKGIWK